MNIILLGAPGSGKGTQSARLVKQHDLRHLATGDMLRAEIRAGSELGKQAQTVMAAGKLVCDHIVIAMIAKRLGDRGALFDGFPRTLTQARALEELLADKGKRTDHAFLLEVDKQEIVKRMLARGRADDKEETIRSRLNVFERQTQPLIEYYEKRGKLSRIDGSGEVQEITARIESVIS